MDNCEGGTSHSVMDDFDVFINHRGSDVKATFVVHLDEALKCAGFRSFLDTHSLIKGNPVFKSIDQAMKMAKVHIAIVSRGYAESKYCLNELVAMVRSGKPVVPVFYGVEPVDLRWLENGPFAKAFEKHKYKGRTAKRLREWKEALATLAGISGFRLADYKSDEAKLKREVVNEVARLIPSNHPVEVEQFRVGLKGPIQSCIEMLESMGTDIGMLSLVGMGGIGKTTLAKEIYNYYAVEKKFKHMTFLELHRDISSTNVLVKPTWSRKLRKQLLWDLFSIENSNPNYTSWFRRISTLGPVFIVIDDVYKLSQFEELVPFTSILHLGSRIIVTSRDRDVLTNLFETKKLYHKLFDVSILNLDHSSMLFNWHAFGIKETPKAYDEITKDIVKACGGLPLALKVIGSSLVNRRLDADRKTIWVEAIDALRQSRDIMDVLRWSYDNLLDVEKRIFLDITCLFHGQDEKVALGYWTSCKNCTSCGGVKTPYTSLTNLKAKNLIQWNYEGKLEVHDLLRDLGQDMGKEAKTHYVDGIENKNQGTCMILGLNLTRSQKRKFKVEYFANMPNLHFLALPDGCSVKGDFQCMSKKLRWFQWRDMPSTSIPLNLNLSNLTSLDFSKSSNLAFLWTESNCGLEAFSNLLQLNLSECTSITKLPKSIGLLSRLQNLTLYYCSNLKMLPDSITQLKALEYLNLGRCSSLRALPNAFGALLNLQTFQAYDCNSLLKLPISIGDLSTLQSLIIGASEECQTFSNGIFEEKWSQLKTLSLEKCGGLESFLNYGALKSLETLSLWSGTFTELPESIGHLRNLKRLRLINCMRLEYLPKSIGNLNLLECLELNLCENFKSLPKTMGALIGLLGLRIEYCSIRRLPKSLGQLSQLRQLNIQGCKNLEKLPTSIRELKSLGRLQLGDCGNIEAMGLLTTLQGLPIWGSTSITKLPPSMGIVSDLIVDGGGYCHYLGCASYITGTIKVLEEDQTGCLKADLDDITGETRLLRESYKIQKDTAISQFDS